MNEILRYNHSGKTKVNVFSTRVWLHHTTLPLQLWTQLMVVSSHCNHLFELFLNVSYQCEPDPPPPPPPTLKDVSDCPTVWWETDPVSPSLPSCWVGRPATYNLDISRYYYHKKYVIFPGPYRNLIITDSLKDENPYSSCKTFLWTDLFPFHLPCGFVRIYTIL